jgi:hypothetical protein
MLYRIKHNGLSIEFNYSWGPSKSHLGLSWNRRLSNVEIATLYNTTASSCLHSMEWAKGVVVVEESINRSLILTPRRILFGVKERNEGCSRWTLLHNKLIVVVEYIVKSVPVSRGHLLEGLLWKFRSLRLAPLIFLIEHWGVFVFKHLRALIA